MPANKLYFSRGLLLALVTLFIDQAHKWYMLEIIDIDTIGKMEVLPFFNLVMVWNKGISFGMGQGTENAAIVFSLIAVVIIIGLLFWLYKCETWLLACSIGLIVGGAIGNVLDRLRFDAVADFFDLYYNSYHWPAFNIADSAVFIGAIMLFIDSLFFTGKKNAKY